MKFEQFNASMDTLLDRAKQTLGQKASEYATDEDRLQNFKQAAGLQNITAAQALQGMMAKHQVSIADMIKSGNQYPQALWDEKIGDALNYLILLNAVIEEESVEMIEAKSSLGGN